jgi:hypothetical protein
LPLSDTCENTCHTCLSTRHSRAQQPFWSSSNRASILHVPVPHKQGRTQVRPLTPGRACQHQLITLETEHRSQACFRHDIAGCLRHLGSRNIYRGVRGAGEGSACPRIMTLGTPLTCAPASCKLPQMPPRTIHVAHYMGLHLWCAHRVPQSSSPNEPNGPQARCSQVEIGHTCR